MASEVDICNLALSHLGDSATVASINPPEGSAQADHCARFYPIARDALLEHPWGFNTKRVTLAQVSNPWPMWTYAYVVPSEALTLLAVMDPAAGDDDAQPYAEELDSSGNKIILTHQENAVLRYSIVVTDTTKFSPLFNTALTWYLASMLAGPIIKGADGAAEGKRCLAIAEGFLGKAQTSDANQQKADIPHTVPWIGGR